MVTKKREDISNLIKMLVDRYKLQIAPLPEIAFPTLNGTLIETPDFTEEHADFEGEEEEMEVDNVRHISLNRSIGNSPTNFSITILGPRRK